MNSRIKDIKGEKFGRLKVVDFSHSSNGRAYWRCVCECGNIVVVGGKNLRRGNTKSCGCIQRKHGEWNTRLYSIWNGMIRRCHTGKSDKIKKYYANKGIEVCEEWRDFLTFKEWALKNGYNDSLTIERVDINKNYCPSNCKWISKKEQSLNQTHTRFLEINGVKKPLTVWAKEKGIHHNTLRYRINKGWNIEDLFKKPQ